MSIATLPATDPDQPTRGRHDVTGRHYGARIDHDGARQALLTRIRDFSDLLGGLQEGLGLAAKRKRKVVDMVPEMAIEWAIANLATAAGAIEHGKVFELEDDEDGRSGDSELVSTTGHIFMVTDAHLARVREAGFQKGLETARTSIPDDYDAA